MQFIKLLCLFLVSISFIASTAADTSALSFFEPEERALMFEFRRGKKKGRGGKKRGGGGGKRGGGGGGGKTCPPPPQTMGQKVKGACKKCAKAVGKHLKENSSTYIAAGISTIAGACLGR